MTIYSLPATAEPLQTGVGPLTQSLPQALLRVLASGLITSVVDADKGGGIVVSERLDWEPPPITGELKVTVGTAYEVFCANLEAVDPEILGRTIGRLLAHFERRYSRDDRDMVLLEALLVDWIEDLGEYPRWAVDRACIEWRRTQNWRPTIADMRRLCEAEVAADRRTLRLLTKLLEAQKDGTSDS